MQGFLAFASARDTINEDSREIQYQSVARIISPRLDEVDSSPFNNSDIMPNFITRNKHVLVSGNVHRQYTGVPSARIN